MWIIIIPLLVLATTWQLHDAIATSQLQLIDTMRLYMVGLMFVTVICAGAVLMIYSQAKKIAKVLFIVMLIALHLYCLLNIANVGSYPLMQWALGSITTFLFGLIVVHAHPSKTPGTVVMIQSGIILFSCMIA